LDDFLKTTQKMKKNILYLASAVIARTSVAGVANVQIPNNNGGNSGVLARRCLLVMLKFVVVATILFITLNFDAIVGAETSGTIRSSGGRYFDLRVEIPVPAFAQNDPRWSRVRLGPSTDTLGDQGCAVTSAAMVVSFYGIKTDPLQLNNFLTRAGGLSDDGLIEWDRVPAIAPAYLRLAYNGNASYELIDSNLLKKNPVIAFIRLSDGGYHFVVIVGKEGHNYLIRDPATSPFRRPYPLSRLTDRIQGVCFFGRSENLR
jgi:hypothetical protein